MNQDQDRPLGDFGAGSGGPGEADRMAGPGAGPHGSTAPLPTFVLVIAIVDLLFCVLRLGFVGLSVLGLMMMAEGAPAFLPGIFEALTGLGIAGFGIPGNALLLAKRRVSLILCKLNLAFTVASMVVSVWSLALMLPQGGRQGEVVAFAVGAAFVLVVRILLAVVYGVALVGAMRYFRRGEPEVPRPYDA